MLYSEQFDNIIWNLVAGTVTANATTAPSGAVTADRGVTNGVSFQVIQGATITSGATVSGSVFLKADGINEVEIVLLASTNTTPYGRATFNVSTGVISVAASSANGGTNAFASITAINNGWYRCVVTVTYPATTSAGMRINAPGATGGIFLWGAQLEAGAFPTSYIPTTTTALTRSADVASVNTLSPWYNATEGTLFGEITDAAITVSGTSRRIANINDGTEADRITVGWAGATGVGAAFVTDNSVTQAIFTSPSGAYPFPTKVALAYKAADFQAAVNGSAFATVSSGTVPTVNRMTIGDVVTGGTGPQNLNGHVRRIAYYPRRLSQAELTAITA